MGVWFIQIFEMTDTMNYTFSRDSRAHGHDEEP